MIEYLIEPASTYAKDIDNLILFIGAVVGFWFFAAEGMFFWLLWRFRYRHGVPAQYVTGKEKHLKRWITIPHGIIIFMDIFVIVGAVRVWYNVKQHLPEPERVIEVTGQQWAWSFVHPGPDNELGTDDDIATANELHLEVDTVYHWKLTSRDVLHSFSIPVFRMKQDAVPGREITGWFEPNKVGVYDIQCAEMCGIGHGIMAARVYVHDHDEFAAWQSTADY
jgi:cytochrome c oxidase subunit 2